MPKSKRYQQTKKKPSFTRLCLLGNSGVGKSTIFNGILQKPIFNSGISIGSSLIEKFQVYNHNKIQYVDIPGLVKVGNDLCSKNANILENAFNKDCPYKIIFVVQIKGNTICPYDIASMKLILEAYSITSYGVIINNVSNSILHRLTYSEIKIPFFECAFQCLEYKPTNIYVNKRYENLENTNNAQWSIPNDLKDFIKKIPTIIIDKTTIKTIDINSLQNEALQIESDIDIEQINNFDNLLNRHVKRGPDWIFDNQDGINNGLGIIIKLLGNAWVRVRWFAGGENSYKFDGLRVNHILLASSEDINEAYNAAGNSIKAGNPIQPKDLICDFGFATGRSHPHFARYDIRDEVCKTFFGLTHGQIIRIPNIPNLPPAVVIGVKLNNNIVTLWCCSLGSEGTGIYPNNILCTHQIIGSKVLQELNPENFNFKEFHDLDNKLTLNSLRCTFNYPTSINPNELYYNLYDISDEICISTGGFKHGDVVGVLGYPNLKLTVVGVALNEELMLSLWFHQHDHPGAGMLTPWPAVRPQLYKIGRTKIFSYNQDMQIKEDKHFYIKKIDSLMILSFRKKWKKICIFKNIEQAITEILEKENTIQNETTTNLLPKLKDYLNDFVELLSPTDFYIKLSETFEISTVSNISILITGIFNVNMQLFLENTIGDLKNSIATTNNIPIEHLLLILGNKFLDDKTRLGDLESNMKNVEVHKIHLKLTIVTEYLIMHNMISGALDIIYVSFTDLTPHYLKNRMSLNQDSDLKLFIESDNRELIGFNLLSELGIVNGDKIGYIHTTNLGKPVNVDNVKIDDIVRQGPNWIYGDQNNGDNNLGQILEIDLINKTVVVRWFSNGYKFNYKAGYNDVYDLVFADENYISYYDAISTIENNKQLQLCHLNCNFAYTIKNPNIYEHEPEWTEFNKIDINYFDIRMEVCTTIGGYLHKQVLAESETKNIYIVIGVKPDNNGTLRLWIQGNYEKGAIILTDELNKKLVCRGIAEYLQPIFVDNHISNYFPPL